MTMHESKGERLSVLDLFSGIGGFSLGLERTGGFKTAAFCEIDPFCQRVLAKHWPEVHCYDDVRTLTAERLATDGISVDVICGGFPCQDISSAGARAGIDGARSGLWGEYARIIDEVGPGFVIVENVSDLRHRGLSDVLRGLASIGYDAEWHCIQAGDVGAPHIRDRLWLVAHPNSEREQQPQGRVSQERRRPRNGGSPVAYAESFGRLADGRLELSAGSGQPRRIHQWSSEPDVGRVAYGVPGRMDRLRALGNAVVPQIPELIGRAILAAGKEAA